jgi:cold shock protein
MPIGTVKFFNDSKGYGFIQPDQGNSDAFVHITALERAGMRTLQQNQRISYDLEQDQRGKMSAVNLKTVDDAAEPAAAEPTATTSDEPQAQDLDAPEAQEENQPTS